MSVQLLLLCLICVTGVALTDGPVNEDLTKYNRQVQIIRDMLTAENCEDPIVHEFDTREILGSNNHLYDIELEVQRKLYQQLRAVLIKCRTTRSSQKSGKWTPTTAQQASTDKTSRKPLPKAITTIPTRTPSTSNESMTTTPTTATAPKTITATTTTPPPKTTTNTATATTQIVTSPSPLPAMCLSATNLTEPWRKDHKGVSIRPKNGGRNCDPREMIAAGRPWFRFSGAAGNRLMNKCVPQLSCGTFLALWSDDPMPTQVGVVARINAYSSSGGICREPSFTKKISVVRCSTSSNDYVYKYDGPGHCSYGFCGMSA